MNYNCPDRQYVSPSRQSNIYNGGVLIINNKPFKTVDYSLYLSHKAGDCNIIQNHKNSSYQRYLQKRKRS
jgi:hypothetical protein